MSQEKVDKYKNEKNHRKEIQKREARVLFLEKLAAVVICIVAAGWIGYSAYSVATQEKEGEVTTTEMDITAMNDYLQELSAGENAE